MLHVSRKTCSKCCTARLVVIIFTIINISYCSNDAFRPSASLSRDLSENEFKPLLISDYRTNLLNSVAKVPQKVHQHTPRHTISSSYKQNVTTATSQRNHTQNYELIKASWPQKIFNCIRSRNLIQCLKIFLLQRSETALERMQSQNLAPNNISWMEDVITFQNDSTVNITKYENLTEPELNKHIIETLFQIFDKRLIKFQLIPGVQFQIVPDQNGSFDLAVRFTDLRDKTTTISRGMKMKMKDLYPLLFVPSVLTTTFLPLMLPGIKMAVMFVMMINQMAFSMSLMSLVRGLIFDPRPSEEIVYVNQGYKNEQKLQHHGPPVLASHQALHIEDIVPAGFSKHEPLHPTIIHHQPEVVAPIHLQSAPHHHETIHLASAPHHHESIHLTAAPPIHITAAPHHEQPVFYHSPGPIVQPEVLHYPQVDVHNVVQTHHSEPHTGLFAEPIGSDGKLLIQEEWHE